MQVIVSLVQAKAELPACLQVLVNFCAKSQSNQPSGLPVKRL